MPTWSPARLRRELVVLNHRALTVRDYALAAESLFQRAIGFDGFCLLTFDPATLLPTSEVVRDGLPPAATARMAEIEVGGGKDFNKFTALARTPLGSRTLSDATHGDLDLSLRHREVRRAHGLGDELRAVLVSDCTAWGAVTWLRDARGSYFTSHDMAVVDTATKPLADGLRRAVVQAALSADDVDQLGVGVLVLESDNS